MERTEQTKTHDVALALSSITPDRSGYAFQGWGMSANATAATYQPGGSYAANKSVTLYAVWLSESVTPPVDAPKSQAVLKIWTSDKGYGYQYYESPAKTVFNAGDKVYLWYTMTDGITGNLLTETYPSAEMTFYNPNGSVLSSHTYTNEKNGNNWKGATVSTAGTYRAAVTINGRTEEVTFSVGDKAPETDVEPKFPRFYSIQIKKTLCRKDFINCSIDKTTEVYYNV
jgi:uncharacterized repeat protein (TIGR02543 family)